MRELIASPSGLAHDRARDDPHRDVEVAHEATDDEDLLRVLLPEVGGVGRDDREELGDDGGDAVEVLRLRALRRTSTSVTPETWIVVAKPSG